MCTKNVETEAGKQDYLKRPQSPLLGALPEVFTFSELAKIRDKKQTYITN